MGPKSSHKAIWVKAFKVGQIFISHGSADKDFVTQTIASCVRAAGLEPWHAVNGGLPAGVSWPNALLEALEGSEAFIVIVSASVLGSPWVAKEVQWWIEQRPSSPLIPIITDATLPSQLHLALAGVQYIDLREVSERSKASLVAALAGKAASSAPALSSIVRSDPLTRHAFLQSLLEETNEFITDKRLTLVHCDDSLTLFDPNLPNPWFLDVTQTEWLLANGRQVDAHGSKCIRRIFELPIGVERQKSASDYKLFFDTAKAVVHAQMYESVVVGLLPVQAGASAQGLSFAYANLGADATSWPAWDYYGGWDQRQALRGSSSDTAEIEGQLLQQQPKIVWLDPYADAHFEAENEEPIPLSWRRFLELLHGDVCGCCGKPKARADLDIHRRFGVTDALFNLTLACKRCRDNWRKPPIEAPRDLTRRLIFDARLDLYFRRSLKNGPRRASHRLPRDLGDRMAEPV